jgi:hypothetical protein
MFIDLLDDDVAQLQDQNNWKTTQDQNWTFFQWTINSERWIQQTNQMKQKSNKRWMNKSNNNNNNTRYNWQTNIMLNINKSRVFKQGEMLPSNIAQS